MVRFLIMLEQTETEFAVQAPDLAIATYGESIEAAKRAKRFGATSKPIEKPDNGCLKRKAFQTILKIPSFGICCSRTST